MIIFALYETMKMMKKKNMFSNKNAKVPKNRRKNKQTKQL